MPKKFVDLLSDDKINREVLTWCKSWDEFVFKVKRVIYYHKYKSIVNKKPTNFAMFSLPKNPQTNF